MKLNFGQKCCRNAALFLISESRLKKISVMIAAFFIFACLSGVAKAQQVDVAFGVGGVKSTSAFDVSNLDQNHSPQSVGGGTFLTLSGDFIFAKHIGAEMDASFRANQNLYQAFGNQQPFRPFFYNFNAIWAPPLGKRAEAEFLGGVGLQ